MVAVPLHEPHADQIHQMTGGRAWMQSDSGPLRSFSLLTKDSSCDIPWTPRVAEE
jgi:hypothetical protein